MDAAVTGDRRIFERLGEGRHGFELARIRPGYAGVVVDASAGGVLIETPRRLLPGARVELQLRRGDGLVAVAGLVLRCAVFRIGPASICYRGAIRFDRDLAGLSGAGHGHELPAERDRGRAPC